MTPIAQTSTSWPEAAIAIAGIALVAIIAFVVISQIAATWRARMSASREDAYRRLAEQAAGSQQSMAEDLQGALDELRTLKQRTSELERMLKQVE